jgi:hypothetical protein
VIHSSLIPRGQPLPKTVGGLTRSQEKRERTATEERRLRDCYRAVDARDQGRCRICGRRVIPGAINSRERAEHHHIVKRSQGGPDTTANVALLCVSRCHDDIHVRALMKLSGDADARDTDGRLCGIRIEKYTDGGDWQVVAWV